MNNYTKNFHKFESPEEILLAYDDSLQTGQVSLYGWQALFHRYFGAPCSHENPIKQLLLANNGAGKSQFILAPAIVWMAVAFDNCLCYVTSSSAQQLDSQTERYIDMLCDKMNTAHRQEFGGDVWETVRRRKYFKPTKSYIDLFATDEPKRAEGKHPLVPFGEFGIFVDEGKSVNEDIYEAISRCHGFTRRLDSSSPGGCIGHFYESATAAAKAGDNKHDLQTVNEFGWRTLRVTSFDCPHISQSVMKQDILKRGLHDPFIRSSYFAEFTSIDSKVVIPRHTFEDCVKHFTKENRFGKRRAGLDLSGGGDETVMSIWEGNINIGQKVYRGGGNPDTSIIVREVIEWIKEYNLDPQQILADDGGVGRGIIGHLADKGYKVRRMLNGWQARDKTYYANRGTENWFVFKRFVEEFQLKLVDDKLLKDQLTNRHYHTNGAKLLLQLESKEKARANGHPSPDRADAAVLAWADYYYPCKELLGETSLDEGSSPILPEDRPVRMTAEDLLRWNREMAFSQRPSSRAGSSGKEFDGEFFLQRDLLDSFRGEPSVSKLLKRN